MAKSDRTEPMDIYGELTVAITARLFAAAVARVYDAVDAVQEKNPDVFLDIRADWLTLDPMKAVAIDEFPDILVGLYRGAEKDPDLSLDGLQLPANLTTGQMRKRLEDEIRKHAEKKSVDSPKS